MDEETYWARVKRVAQMMDIRTAMITDAQVDHALQVLRKVESCSLKLDQEDLQSYRKIKETVVHPDTGEKIFFPLRLSFIVPCNLILDTLMLSARGTLQNVGAQWLNQTYNSLHYYANRNATNSEGTSEIIHAYCGATVGSVGAAVGLNSLLDKVPARTKWTSLVRRVIPFCAVAAADVLNLGIMRKNEFLEGINVFDSEGQEVGKSRLAGSWAVGSCISGRIAAAAPILLLPPLVMHKLEATEFLRRRLWLKTPLLMTTIGVSIQVCVPLVFGIFKQRAEINVRSLEPEFQNLVDKHGNTIHKLSYNKGL